MKTMNRKGFKEWLQRYPMNESGQGLTEYIALLVLVSLVAVGATQKLGTKLREKIVTATKHVNEDIVFRDVNR